MKLRKVIRKEQKAITNSHPVTYQST